MNPLCKRLITVLLAVLLCCIATGCGGADTSVYMDYGTGIDEFGRYNTELYGNNGISDSSNADPGVFYVSVEDDPVYGGYYYRYITGQTTVFPATDYYKAEFISKLAFYCDRSQDLYHWEPAGALAGSYSLAIDTDDWCDSDFWAPEVIRNPADGKYYMYFSASAKRDLGVSYISSAENYTDRCYIGIAVSDSPVGPFDIIGDLDEETGKLVPTVNFQTAFGLEYNVSVIDPHPYFDEDGQLYLYFVRQGNEHWDGSCTAGVKMESMVYADYSTAVILTAPGAASVTCTPGDFVNIQRGGDYYDATEGNINEGPFMYRHNGKYYLTYSSHGYEDPGYSVHQAIGDSPLGPFTKLSAEEGNPVLNGNLFNDVVGSGHHCFVEAGDELMIIYHRWSSAINGMGWAGRPTAVDRVVFVKNSDGVEVMTSNGPSRILSWLPESISGYQNLTQTATVSVSNGTGVQYLSDGALSLYDVTREYTLSVDSGDVTVTLSWAEPVCVSAVMVYNSATSDSAFSQISRMQFKLAQQPDWASKNYDWAVIENVPLQYGAWNEETEKYLEGAPAVADFDPIWVTEIRITIKEADRLQVYDKLGQPNTLLDVSEIVVLGGDVANE